MGKFLLTKQAVEDLKAIGRYTQKKWGHEQRNAYLIKLDKGFRLVADNPQIGKNCSYIRTGYRVHQVGRHLIFYRQFSNYIEIVRVLHERMNIEDHFVGPLS